jgi:hypothetical protein
MSEPNSMDVARDLSRALDWRAERARQLVLERRYPSPRADDKWTAALAKFYRERNSAGPGSRSPSAP